MAFDDATRGRLQTFVGRARTFLTVEFASQFQQDYGLDPEFRRCRIARQPGAS